MVPGYYMSKRGVSLPKLDEKDLSIDITRENSMTNKRNSKVSPRNKQPITELAKVDLKQINKIKAEDLGNLSTIIDQ